MNEIKKFNYNTLEKEVIAKKNNQYIYLPIIAPNSNEARQCHIAMIEIPPLQHSYEYHYHELDEEVFYIIKGTGKVRTPKEDIEVKEGDVLFFPNGPSGAHMITNISSTESLLYIDFDTHNLPEITHFIDEGRININTQEYSYDMKEEDISINTPRRKKRY